VHATINNISKELNIPTTRIVVGGFSQGGAMTLYASYLFDAPLAGICAFSCFLPLHSFLYDVISSSANKTSPLLFGHGLKDPNVPHEWGRRTVERLGNEKVPVMLKLYPNVNHTLDVVDEKTDFRDWLLKYLPILS
jgi:predicted esterase